MARHLPALPLMSVRITNLRLPVEESELTLPAVIARRLKLPVEALKRLQIRRKSLDARKRTELLFVYSVLVELQDEDLSDSFDEVPVDMKKLVKARLPALRRALAGHPQTREQFVEALA